MSGRPSLAGAFAPAAVPVRGAALQGLLAPKRRGSDAQPLGPDPESVEREESVDAPAGEAVKAPTVPDRGPEARQSLTVEQAPPAVDERGAAGGEPVSAFAQAQSSAPRPKATIKRTEAPEVKASQRVPGALRNVGVYLPPSLLADVKDAVYQSRTTYADLLIDAFEAVDDERIAREFATEISLTSSGMPRRAPRKRGEAGIQIQLRLDGLQVAWLDEKVTEFDAPSRSALVSAVFKLHIEARKTAEE